jgi:hypothetical protein
MATNSIDGNVRSRVLYRVAGNINAIGMRTIRISGLRSSLGRSVLK